MKQSADIFWDVREQEAVEERVLRDKIDTVQRRIGLCRRARALQGAAGFAELLEATRGLYEKALNKLATAVLDDGALREQRGRVMALRDVLAGMEKSDDAVQHLAAQEVELQNQLKAVLHARPKPRSE
jgi:hypothetical protein